MSQSGYTVAIQRWPLPVYKKFKVIGHNFESLGSSVRANLLFEDGSSLAVPGLDRRRVKIYPDYHKYHQQFETLPAAASDGGHLLE